MDSSHVFFLGYTHRASDGFSFAVNCESQKLESVIGHTSGGRSVQYTKISIFFCVRAALCVIWLAREMIAEGDEKEQHNPARNMASSDNIDVGEPLEHHSQQ